MKQLQHRNVFGRIAKVGEGEGVTRVTTLPENGKEGEIYYNTTEKKYYLYDGASYSPIGSQGMPHGEAPENISQSPLTNVEYALKPDTYYDFDEFYTEDITVAPLPVIINFDDINNEAVANSYVFRMTVPTSGVMNITMRGIIIPDSAKEILDDLEQGHRYEFNVFDKVLLIVDITETP